jgi:hypothetical protein
MSRKVAVQVNQARLTVRCATALKWLVKLGDVAPKVWLAFCIGRTRKGKWKA